MPAGFKWLIAVVFLLFLLGLVGLGGYREIQHVIEADQLRQQNLVQRIVPSFQMEAAILRLNALAQKMVDGRLDRSTLFKDLQDQQSAFNGAAARYQAAFGHDGDLAKFYALQSTYTDYTGLLTQMGALWSAGKFLDLSTLYYGQFSRLSRTHEAQVQNVRSFNEDAGKQNAGAAHALIDSISLALINVMAFVVLISLILGIWLSRLITRSLNVMLAPEPVKFPTTPSAERLRQACLETVNSAVANASANYHPTMPAVDQILDKLLAFDQPLANLVASVNLQNSMLTSMTANMSTLKESSPNQ